jgi:hypothetical protein
MIDASSDATGAASAILASLSDVKIEKLLENEPANIDEDLIHPPTPALPFPELDAASPATISSSSAAASSSAAITTTNTSMIGGNYPPILSAKSESS